MPCIDASELAAIALKKRKTAEVFKKRFMEIFKRSLAADYEDIGAYTFYISKNKATLFKIFLIYVAYGASF